MVSGQVVAPSCGPTRTAAEFRDHIAPTVATDPTATRWHFAVDNLNIHTSTLLVRYVAELCGCTEDLGVPGKHGILRTRHTRAAFFSAGESWGHFTQRAAGGALHWGIELVGGGDLTVSTLRLRYPSLAAGAVHAEAAGAPVDALADGDGDDLVVELAAPVTVKRGQALRLTLPLTGSARN